MAESLDVFAVLGNEEYLWIGCVFTKDDAIRLISERGLQIPAASFLVRSQRTGNRTFYKTGHNNTVLQLEHAAG